MIISASRRTDIPAFYSQWFFSRLQAGYVMVRNPFNFRQISKINLAPENIDGIVFWTKNPLPMLKRLDELKAYPYYFQFTLTPYGKEIEPHLPDKENVLIPAFRQLAGQLGPERVIWRYDPILLTEKYNLQYHCEAFRILAKKLSGCTEQCVISFLDIYKNTARSMRQLPMRTPDEKLQDLLMENFAKTAARYKIKIAACAEARDFSEFGVSRSACVSAALLERAGGFRLAAAKDRGQRSECLCCQSADIGAYNTCLHSCLYCYANYNRSAAAANYGSHDPCSPLLYGWPQPDDIITEKKAVSLKIQQESLF